MAERREFKTPVCCACGRDPFTAGVVMGDPALCDACLGANWPAIIDLVKSAAKVHISPCEVSYDRPSRAAGFC